MCIKYWPHTTWHHYASHITRQKKSTNGANTDAKVSVDAGISCCSRQVLVLAVRNVLMSPCVSILLRQAKVDYVDEVTLFAETHQEVVGLDVSMYQVLGMNVFHTTYL